MPIAYARIMGYWPQRSIVGSPVRIGRTKQTNLAKDLNFGGKTDVIQMGLTSPLMTLP